MLKNQRRRCRQYQQKAKAPTYTSPSTCSSLTPALPSELT